MLRYDLKTWAYIAVGDYVSFWKTRNPKATEHRRAGWIVVEVEGAIADRHRQQYMNVTIARATDLAGARQDVTHKISEAVYVEVIGSCDAPLCAAHGKRVGPDADLCLTHLTCAPCAPAEPTLFDSGDAPAQPGRPIDRDLEARRKELLL